jgi:hypothetical protein
VQTKPTFEQRARQYYTTKCLTCHGRHGAGDGPGAEALDVKPRAFGNPEWQKSATDERLRQAIVEGGTAVGLDETMTAFPELARQPEVLKELIELIRGFDRSRRRSTP